MKPSSSDEESFLPKCTFLKRENLLSLTTFSPNTNGSSDRNKRIFQKCTFFCARHAIFFSYHKHSCLGKNTLRTCIKPIHEIYLLFIYQVSSYCTCSNQELEKDTHIRIFFQFNTKIVFELCQVYSYQIDCIDRLKDIVNNWLDNKY